MTATPPLFDTLVALGRDRTLAASTRRSRGSAPPPRHERIVNTDGRTGLPGEHGVNARPARSGVHGTNDPRRGRRDHAPRDPGRGAGARGVPGRRRRQRPRGARAVPRRASRPRPAGPDAPRALGRRGVPDHPGRVGRADHHADGEGRGGRQGGRPRARRRRLRHQAVQPARAQRPHPGDLPAGGAGARRPTCRRSSTSAGSRWTSPATACCATATPCRSSPRRSSCSRSCSATRARSSPATSCSSTSGATTTAGESRTVDVHIHWLRSEIEEDPAAPEFLHTVRGVGYVFRRPA